MNPAEMESLALAKSFQQLSPAERDAVLAHLGSRDAYERMRALLAVTMRELENDGAALRPRADIRESVRGAMKGRDLSGAARGSGRAGIFGRRIPLYQAFGMAAVAAALTLVVIGRSSPFVASVPERVVLMPKIDTVMAVFDQDSLIRHIADSIADAMSLNTERRGRRESPPIARRPERSKRVAVDEPQRREEHTIDRPAPQPNTFVGLGNLSLLEWQRRGRNLVEDSALRRFSTTVAGMKN
jgi:hypothetical protein